MAATEKIQINIDTRADTSGAEKSEAAIKRVDRAAQDAEAHAERQAQRNARTSGVTFDNPIYSETVTSSAKAIETLDKKAQSGGDSMGKMGTLANQASYQIQDFAVQVGGGTSAITAFAQQAPQLIGAMASAGVVTKGMGMALSGVGVAIPILAFGLPALARMFMDTGDSAEVAAEKITKLSKTESTASFENLRKMAESLRLADEKLLDLQISFPLLKKAEGDYSLSALTNTQLLGAAQTRVADALGLQIDKVLALEAAEARAEAIRQAKLQNGLTELKGQWEAVNKEGLDKAMAFNRLIDEATNAAELRTRKMVELARLRNDLAEAEKINAAPSDRPIFGARIPGGVSDESKQWAGDVLSQKSATDTRIAALEADLKKIAATLNDIGDGKGEGKLAEAGRLVEEVDRKIEDTRAAISTTVEKLNNDNSTQETLSQLSLIEEKQKADAATISQALGQVTATTTTGEGVVASLSAAASTGAITAEKSGAAVQNLTTMIGLIQSNQVITEGSSQQLINMLRQVIAHQLRLKADYESIRSKIPALGYR